MKRRRLLVIPAVAALVALPASVLGAAAQAPEDAEIIHRQAVSVQMSPTGEQGTTRLVTQLTYLGNESSSITLPAQATRGFRNLSGFGAPSVSGDNVTWDFAGPGFVRSLAEVDRDLPIRVEISYSLDGQEMAPEEIVGRNGLLEVTYTVTNLTAEDREINFVDGLGNPQTATVPVAVPMVGSLTTTLDGRFDNVESPGAVVVGDGRGNTLISASLLMFAPLASDTAQATYRAQVTDAIIPTTKLQVLPVDSNSFGSIASTEAAYSGAAESLTELADGSGQIDQNLQTLAAGAGELLDGLSQLADGADELAAGLQTAQSGSGRLAAGTTEARAGGQRLAAGLDLLLAGARELSGGLGQANAGGGDLAAGLARLATGAGELSAGAKTLAAGTTDLNAGATELSAGAKALAAGSNTLDTGAQELVAGAGELSGGAADLLDGLKLLKASLNADDGLPSALDGIGMMLAGIGSAATPDTLVYGLTRIAGGLSNPACDLGNPTDPANPCGIIQVLGLLQVGVSNPLCDVTDPYNPMNPCGAKQGVQGVAAGLGDAETGALAIEAAAGQVDTGLAALYNAITPVLAAYAADPVIAGLLGTIQTNIGNPAGPAAGTLLYAAGAIEVGAADLADGAALGVSTLDNVVIGLDKISQGLAGLEAAVGDPMTADTLRYGVARVLGGLDTPCDFNAPETCVALKQGLQLLQAGLTGALADVNAGLGDPAVAGETLLYGAGLLAGGAAQLEAGAEQLQTEGTAAVAAGAAELAAGAEKLQAEGTAPLEAGAAQVADGAGQVGAGAAEASAGAGTLVGGLGQLADGGQALASGVGEAESGSNDLAAGLGELNSGARQLADGLGDAADGSQQLADGLGDAFGGGEQIADGAAQLQEEGTGQLVTSVAEAAGGSSLQVAQIRAVNERGQTEKMPFGTVEGAAASAVYQFEIAGVAADAGGLGTVPQTGLAAALLAGAGLLGAGVRRRMH